MDEGIAAVLANERRWAVACGDAVAVLKQIPESCVQVCMCSPPYFQLRDYKTGYWEGGSPECDHKKPNRHQNLDKLGKKHSAEDAPSVPYTDACGRCGARRIDQQIGLESLHDCAGYATGQRCGKCFICKLTAVFDEVRRVLTPSGICVVNLGDSYGGDRGNKTSAPDNKNKGAANVANHRRDVNLRKQILGIPWRFALSMQAAGWVLRNDCPWVKPSPMPSSCTDRLHVAHEYIFVFSRKPKYFWDSFAVRQPSASTTLSRDNYTRITTGKDGEYAVAHDHETPSDPAGRHWRTNDVWLAGLDVTIAETEDYLRHLRDIREGRGMLTDTEGEPLAVRVASESYGGEHYAVFPQALVRGFLLAGCSARGCCSVCLAPYERITKPSEQYAKFLGKGFHDHQDDGVKGMGMQTRGVGRQSKMCQEGIMTAERVSVGWQSTCSHHDAPTIPNLVLDCFGGSGTVGVVAEQLSLRSICIDLSPDHCRQAEARIATALRLDELKTKKGSPDEPNLFASLENHG